MRRLRRAPCPSTPRIEVAGTAPFDGIAGYLRHLPGMLGANRATLRRAIDEADLLWLKVPASNATLAAAIARRAGTPGSCGWPAAPPRWPAPGSTGSARVGAGAVGLGYDAIGRLAGVGGHRLVVGEGLVDGDGVVASLVEPHELRDPGARPWAPGAAERRARLVWAGRLAAGKGIESLLGARRGRPVPRARRPRRRPRPRAPGRARRDVRASRAVSGGPATSPIGRRTWTGWSRPTRSSSRRPPRGSPRSCSMPSRSGCPCSRRRRGPGRAGRGGPHRADRVPGAGRRARRVAPTRRDGPVDRRRAALASERLRGPPHARGRGRRLVERWRAWWPTCRGSR